MRGAILLKKIRLLLFIMFLSMGLFGCQQSSEDGDDVDGKDAKQGEEIENVQKEGYILKVEEGNILVAENITLEKYEEIKDKTDTELHEEGLSLIYVSYDDTSSLQVGNKVEIWIEGGIRESYPAQADASEIKVIE
jgi:hypothetical protein